MRIRQKILFVVLPVVIASILAISIIAINNFLNSTKNEVIEKLKLIGNNNMDKVSRVMFERVADVKFLASNNVTSNPEISIRDKVNFLRSAERAYKAYSSMSLYNSEGIKIGDTRSLYIGVNESQKPFFTHSIKGELYYDKIPVLSQSLSQYVIHFSAPLYSDNGTISGVLVTRYPITKLNEILRSSPDNSGDNSIPNTIRTDLIASNGLVIYSNYNRQSMLNDNLSRLAIFKLLTNDIIINQDERAATMPVTTESSTRYGESLFVGVSQGSGYLDYDGSGWFLILSESTKDAFAALQNTVFQFIAAAGIILAIAVVLILIFSDRLIVPISRLRNVALLLSEGKYDVSIPSYSGDEIGDLSNALNVMRTRIMETNKHLNDLVEQKTQELTHMNQSLTESKNHLEFLNQSLIQSDKAKEEFIMMVSHELKTPITPAKIYLEVFLKTKTLGNLSDKQSKAILAVYRSVLRLEDLVNDVLDVYKLDVGKLSLRKEEVLVKDLIHDSLLELRPLMKNKSIHFSEQIHPSCQTTKILCDPKRISQVIRNLVTNSIDFVPSKGGKIALRAEPNQGEKNEQGSSIWFSVEDNGPGIPKDKIGNLFKKFYQIDTSLTRKHGGTGLGLAISKGIVNAHGGKIWVDLGYESGTCMKFSIPLN